MHRTIGNHHIDALYLSLSHHMPSSHTCIRSIRRHRPRCRVKWMCCVNVGCTIWCVFEHKYLLRWLEPGPGAVHADGQWMARKLVSFELLVWPFNPFSVETRSTIQMQVCSLSVFIYIEWTRPAYCRIRINSILSFQIRICFSFDFAAEFQHKSVLFSLQIQLIRTLISLQFNESENPVRIERAHCSMKTGTEQHLLHGSMNDGK